MSTSKKEEKAQVKTYSYVRISTDRQRFGHGIKRQISLAEQYAAEHGLVIDQEFSLKDIGKSAYNGKNISEGTLGEFLQAIKNGKITKGSNLLIESLDRLSRENIKNAASIMLDIVKSGVNIITVNPRKVYEAEKFDPIDMIESTLILSRAHEESVIKSERLKARWKDKRGDANNKKLTSRCPSWLQLDKQKNQFIVIESKAKIVIRIFDDALNGFGALAIANQLNKEKIPPFGKADGWHKSSVQNTLNNIAVMGHFQPHILEDGKRIKEGDVIFNYFPVIVSEQIFNAVQGSISVRKSKGGGRKGEGISNIFSKLTFCGYCGSKIHYINKGKSSGSFLTCDNRKRAMGCVAIPWKYSNFEEAFLTFVTEANIAELLDADNINSRIKEIDVNLLSVQGQIIKEEKSQEKNYIAI